MSVRVLKPRAEKPNQAVINALRGWLETAKSGELRGVVLLGVNADDTNVRSQAGEMGYANTVYLCQVTAQEIIHEARARTTLQKLPEPTGEDQPPKDTDPG